MRAWIDGVLVRPDWQEHPLLTEFKALADRYFRLQRQVNKITRISDRVQEEMKQLNHALRVASLSDPLTTLANRRAMMERLRSEASRVSRGGRPFSLIIADIDFFKRINDTWGHDAGDMVLVATAQTLRHAVREHDLCARWGGEEFVVLLPDTEPDQALAAAEKLREAVAAQSLAFEGNAIPVTMSFGIASFDPDLGIEDCLQAADRCLYLAKTRGRNNCVCEAMEQAEV